MEGTDKVIVVGIKENVDSVRMRLPDSLKGIKIVATESASLPEGCVAVMPEAMLDKIDEIDFSAVPRYSAEPKVTMEFRLPEIPKMTDMSGYFKEQERQQKLQQRETMKNLSRLHSKGFKK